MKPKLIFFDCDGVLTHDSFWSKLHREINLPEEMDNQWFSDYYYGKITYKQWGENLDRFYRKHKNFKEIVTRLLNDLSVTDEAKDICSYLHAQKIPVAIISSGLKEYVSIYAKLLNINIWKANCWFEFEEDNSFRHVGFEADDQDAKVIHIKEVCGQLGIDPEDTFFVGDSVNDIKAFQSTRHGILYKTKNKEYEKYAWKKIDDLMEIKKIIVENVILSDPAMAGESKDPVTNRSKLY